MSDDIPDPIPVCISTKLPNNSSGVVVSFGKTDIGLEGVLNKIEIEAVTNADCKALNVKLAENLENSHFCGKTPENTGACQGDSGAGFLYTDQNDKWNLHGILSASLVEGKSACDAGESSKLIIFVDILYYLDWIGGNDLNGTSTTNFDDFENWSDEATEKAVAPNFPTPYYSTERYIFVRPKEEHSDIEWDD